MITKDYVANVKEAFVQSALDKALPENTEVCRCPRCVADMKTLALNGLSPHYVPLERMKALSLDQLLKNDELAYAAITHATYAAIHRVRSNPRHGEASAGAMVIHNQRELLVAKLLAEACKEREQLLECRQCVQDVLAAVLNQIPTSYVSTLKGESFKRADELEAKYHTDLLVKMFNAMDALKHDEHAGAGDGSPSAFT